MDETVDGEAAAAPGPDPAPVIICDGVLPSDESISNVVTFGHMIMVLVDDVDGS